MLRHGACGRRRTRRQERVGRGADPGGLPCCARRGGQDGLRLAREATPDAIILDVIMPDLDGWTVLRSLKADPDSATFRLFWSRCWATATWVSRLAPPNT